MRHSIPRDGIIAGALGATAVAVWFLIVDVLTRIPGVICALSEEADASVRFEAQSEEALREVSRAIQDQRWLLLEMKRETLGLEEIFLSLVHEEKGMRSVPGSR